MEVKDYLRQRFLPHIWCAGCGHGIIMGNMIRAIDQLHLKKKRYRGSVRHRMLLPYAGIPGLPYHAHHSRSGPGVRHGGQNGPTRTERDRSHGRRGCTGHRRQPSDPCGQAKCGPDGHHHEQQYLRNDRGTVFPHSRRQGKRPPPPSMEPIPNPLTL